MRKGHEMRPIVKKTKTAQDRAAGGEQMRKVKLPDGSVATASVSAQKFSKGHQVWGYLRFKTGGKTLRYYIGKVTANTLDESLAIGWCLAREKKILEGAGWSWLVSSSAATEKKNRARKVRTSRTDKSV